MFYDGPEIYVGFPWIVDLHVIGWDFLSGGVIRAEVRHQPEDTAALLSMTSNNNGIVVLSKEVIRLRMTSGNTEDLPPDSYIMFDIVQGEAGEEVHLGITFIVPVVDPTTKAL